MTDNQIKNDKRPIKSVWSNGWDEGTEVGATVGYQGVTRIEPYEENGDMAAITWFMVWKGDKLHARLNSLHMAEVQYD